MSCHVSLTERCAATDGPLRRFQLELTDIVLSRAALKDGDLTMALIPGNLVRWRNGPSGNVGVVVPSPSGVRVRLDSGDEHTFAAHADALERLLFEPGAQVEFLADHTTGVVAGRTHSNGVAVYEVVLPSGVKTALEDALRPAVISDPVALWRAGRIHSSRSCNLRITATRLSFAHQFDPLSSLSNSRVEIKPHQVGVVHRVSTSYPHRFLLADEVGLGKTIEAGLIIRELKARGVAKRVLVLAPSGIVSQWQYELRTKFNQVFAQYRSDSVRFLQSKNPAENVWTLEDNVIASTAYAVADEERSKEIALAGWDLIIIDEAHHARRQMDSETKRSYTRLYRLAETLTDQTSGGGQSVLLLTATPMQLDPFELYSLIELLDPTLFANYADFESHRVEVAGLNATVDAVKRWSALKPADREQQAGEVARWLSIDLSDARARLGSAPGRASVIEELLGKHKLSEVMVRNRKAVVGGFTSRKAAVWPVEMTDQEWDAYHAIGEYVRVGYARSRAINNNALGFLMTTFQKLSSSSSYALRQSLLRRIEKLEAALPAAAEVEVEDSDLEESPIGDALDEILGISSKPDVAAEIQEVARVVQLLDKIDMDSKTKVLLARLGDIKKQEEDAKVLIFTQSRDTQEYLRLRLSAPWEVNVFHGQLKPDAKDAAVLRFREGRGPQVLISTEAGGEGRNFQFCHVLINYDLPWNPMRIEQRIGRLDRIGQKHPVTIINFAISGTIEERVLEVVSERIRVFEETIGGLDPILGTVEQDLREVFLAGEAERREALERLESQLEDRIRDARDAERKLTDLIMDTKSFRQDEVQTLLDQKGAMDNHALRRFVINALSELGVYINEDPEVAGIYELRLQGLFLDEFPPYAKEGLTRRVTFSPAVALDYEAVEFLAFGHELVDGLVARVRGRPYEGATSHRVVRTNEKPPRKGWLFNFVLELDGVESFKEVFPVFVGDEGAEDPDLAVWLLERAARGKREDFGQTLADSGSFESAVSRAATAALDRLVERRDQLSSANHERLERERAKLSRFYEYRVRAAQEKLESVERIYERVSVSSDPGEQKIAPVWAKNLDSARRVLVGLEQEKTRRLSDLSLREQVVAQHELLSISFVEIIPEV